MKPDYIKTSDGLFAYKYPRAAITADIVIFGFDGYKLNVLLIRRKEEPFEGRWALPGGFMKMHETIEECAVRELGEETKYIASDLKQFGVFSKVDRDPRYRVVTVAFYALSEVRPVEGGSDAKEARWFPLGEEPDLPFDHNEILKAAKQRLHDDLYLRPVGFDLLPKIFSIPQLQRLYETILDKSFDRRNFQKKMLSTKIVQRVDSTGIVEQKRTTILYSFNKEEYENLKKNGDFRIEF